MKLTDILNIGVDVGDGQNYRLVRLCNLFALICKLHFILSFLKLIYFDETEYAFVLLISSVSLLLTFYLNKRKHYFAAQIYLFSVVVFSISLFTLLLGKESGAYFYYIPTFAFFMGMVNVELFKKYLWVILPVLLICFIVVYLAVFGSSPKELYYPKELFFSSFFFSFLLTTIVLFWMAKAYQESWTESRSMLEELKLKNEELSKNEELLQKNVEKQHLLHNALIDFQQSLKQSKNNLKALIDNSNDFIWSVNNQYEIVSANKVFLDYFKKNFGIEYKEGSSLFVESLPTDIHNILRDGLERAFNGEKYVKEVSYDGRTYESFYTPIIENKTIRGVAVYSKDVTEERKLNKQIVSSENTLRSIVENISGGIGLFDLEFKTIYSNLFLDSVVYNEFGNRLRYGEPIYTFIPEEFHPVAETLLQKIKNNEVFTSDIQVKTNRYYNVSAFPILDITESVTGFTVLVMDISAHKIAEKESIDNKKKREEVVKSKENFLAMMSHELRTPMNAVIGMTHLLLQENPREDQLENLKTLKFSAENLLHIINDVLDYSKLEVGKVNFERISFNLHEHLDRVCKSFLPKVVEKGIILDLVFDNRLQSKVIGDPYRLSQVLNNLLSNAVKFTEKGTISVSVQLVNREGNHVQVKFSVKDTGIGISEDKLDYVFEAFNQAEDSISRVYGGTGLGLSITKKLLELHGSSIQVKSKLNEGTEFVFELGFDLAIAEAVNVELNEEFNDSDIEGKRVLLVEDHPINKMVAVKFLNKFNLVVDVAEDGEEAIHKFSIGKYDLILMDLQLPKVNGYEATKEIRRIDAEIPILAMTASIVDESRSNVFSSGFDDIVTKPFDPKVLKTLIFYYTIERKKPKGLN